VTAIALAPGVVADWRLSVDPADADYPALDRGQYVTSWSSGFGMEEAAARLRTLAAARPMTVGVAPPVEFSTMWLLLLDTPNIVLEPSTKVADDPAVRYFLVNVDGVPPELDGKLRLLWQYDRPHDGTPVRIYERAV
jgi:hypothetical protein